MFILDVRSIGMVVKPLLLLFIKEARTLANKGWWINNRLALS
jgi:hypothetical protein